MARLARGLIAGAAATVPQTIAMEVTRRWMPVHPGRFPPRQVTEEVLAALHVRRRFGFSESTWQALTTICHFAYGASAGAIYSFSPRRMHSLNGGTVFGFLIWAGSYGVLLPLLRITRPQTDHPIRKNLQLIIAHLIYGSSLALVSRLLSDKLLGYGDGSLHLLPMANGENIDRRRVHTCRSETR